MKSEPLLSLEYNAERGDDGRKKIRDANQIAAMIMSQWVGLIFKGFTLFLCTYCILNLFFHERLFDSFLFGYHYAILGQLLSRKNTTA